MLAATRECVGLLRGGQVLLVFPEGYPNIDPSFTPKLDDGAFLPFEPGFLRFVALAEQDGITRVPIVPVGLDTNGATAGTSTSASDTRCGIPRMWLSRPDRRDRGAGAAAFRSGARPVPMRRRGATFRLWRHHVTGCRQGGERTPLSQC